VNAAPFHLAAAARSQVPQIAIGGGTRPQECRPFAPSRGVLRRLARGWLVGRLAASARPTATDARRRSGWRIAQDSLAENLGTGRRPARS